MSFKLDFVVIGAQKCATTWLYDCMVDHPGLNLRNNKNEDYYYGGAAYRERGHDWYAGQFAERPGQLYGCVSVDYIEDLAAAKLLQQLNPQMKVLASLRNPISRSVSAYQWYVRKALIPDLPLEEALRRAIVHYREGRQDNFASLIARSVYAPKLAAYFELFPAEQVQVVFYEAINQAPAETLRGVFGHLGVDAGFVPPNLNTKPKQNTGFAPLIRLQRMFPQSRIVGKVVDVANQKLFAKQVATQKHQQQLDPALLADLKAVFAQPIADLQQMLRDKGRAGQAEQLAHYWAKSMGA